MTSLLILFLGAILVLYFGIRKPEKKSTGITILLLISALSFLVKDWFAFKKTYLYGKPNGCRQIC